MKISLSEKEIEGYLQEAYLKGQRRTCESILIPHERYLKDPAINGKISEDYRILINIIKQFLIDIDRELEVNAIMEEFERKEAEKLARKLSKKHRWCMKNIRGVKIPMIKNSDGANRQYETIGG